MCMGFALCVVDRELHTVSMVSPCALPRCACGGHNISLLLQVRVPENPSVTLRCSWMRAGLGQFLPYLSCGGGRVWQASQAEGWAISLCR